MTPKMRAYLARRARKAERRRFRLDADLLRAVVVVIREAREEDGISTLFGLEGPLVAVLRADLCLRGWAWWRADMAARDLVGEALRTLGAKRPSWQEGQPEWCDGGVIRSQRIRCANCGGAPLPPENKVFCCRHCGDNFRKKLAWQDDLEARRAASRLRSRRRRDAAG